jgi:xanthine dehydrogenase molybdenum-binding subunit/putative selenate reductase molybdopterin-binding subunit
MAYAAIVRSPYSRARVISIDVSGAERVPGYLGCLLPEEVPQKLFNCSGNPPSPLLLRDELVLTREPKVLGDRVLCVAAETEEACRLAADAVRVCYEELNPYLDIRSALAKCAQPLQPTSHRTTSFSAGGGPRATGGGRAGVGRPGGGPLRYPGHAACDHRADQLSV